MVKVEIAYSDDGENLNTKKLNNHLYKLKRKLFDITKREDYYLTRYNMKVDMVSDVIKMYCDVNALWNKERQYIISGIWLFSVQLLDGEKGEKH